MPSIPAGRTLRSDSSPQRLAMQLAPQTLYRNPVDSDPAMPAKLRIEEGMKRQPLSIN